MVGSPRRIPCIARGSGGPKRPTGRIRAESRPVARACASPTANSAGTGHNCVPQVDPCLNRPRNMRRRMRLRVLLAGAVLPLALWAALPVFSEGASSPSGRLHDLQHKIQGHAGQDRQAKGHRAPADDADQRLLAAHRAPAGPHRHPAEPAGQRAGRPRRQAQRAVRDPARPARRAPAARAPARPPGAGPHGARAAAGRALPGRQARHRDGDHVLQGLRRAARARGVHAARVRAGPEHHQDRARRQGRRDRHRGSAWTSSSAASRSITAIVQQRRDQIARAKQGLIDTKVGLDGTRADKARALGTVRAERQPARGQPLRAEGRAGQDRGHAAAGRRGPCPPGRSSRATAA